MKILLTAAFALFFLFLPVRTGQGQDLYRSTRSLEVQQAISHIGQAEYYTRMALRSLAESEKAGRAPFFDYKKARDDLDRILNEFRSYLGGDGSPARAAAVPLIIDGRYFSESIKDYLSKLERRESFSAYEASAKNLKKPEPVGSGTWTEIEGSEEGKEVEMTKKKRESPSNEPAAVLPPPVAGYKGEEKKREKIAEILKKGL